MLIDLHNHTFPASDDSFLRPHELIQAAKAAGLDGIAITEHDWFWEPRDLEALGREHRFLLLPGVEINTEDGHMLVFGVHNYIFGMHRAAFLKQVVDRAGGAMVIAHPYRRRFDPKFHNPDGHRHHALERACATEALALAHAIEVHNGRGSAEENEFSADLCRRLGLPGIGASDAHKADDVGRWATEFQRDVRTAQELIQELKAGRFRPVRLKG
ncbi:MAG: PHP domain-containing protein [Chloroflexi bacterium]|nr:PHP domain-containing protein [Chloroflexota bacterium]